MTKFIRDRLFRVAADGVGTWPATTLKQLTWVIPVGGAGARR